MPLWTHLTHHPNIEPIDWQLKIDQNVTERGRQLCHCQPNWHVAPIDWQVKLDQGITKFYMNANFANVKPIDTSNPHQTNWLAIRIRPGCHWMWMPPLPLLHQLTYWTNWLANRIRSGRCWNFTWTLSMPMLNQFLVCRVRRGHHWILHGRQLCHCWPVNTLNQHQTNWLAIRIRSGHHWTWMPLLTKSNQSTRCTNQLASRIRPGRHWISRGGHLCHCLNHRHFESNDWCVELY